MFKNSVPCFQGNFAKFKSDQNADGISELGLHGAKSKSATVKISYLIWQHRTTDWLHVLIKSRTRFRVNLHSIVTWMSRTPCSKQARYLKFKWLQRDWPVWPNGCVFVYNLSGYGFESCCCHLNGTTVLKRWIAG